MEVLYQKSFDFNDILTRVTICDILNLHGYYPKGSRMACPIHGGRNKTAFSFNDFSFYCFSCGAKGGLVSLTEYLRKCTKADAIKYLCDITGLPYVESCREKSKIPIDYSLKNHDPYIGDEKYFIIKMRLLDIDLIEYALVVCLKTLRSAIKQRLIEPVDYYTMEQIYHYQLENLDTERAYLQHELNLIKRRVNNGNTK